MKTKPICIMIFVFTLVLSGGQVYAQKKGSIKADFVKEKVIITKETIKDGKSETKKIEIDAPEGYAAFRGDVFTFSLPFRLFDKSGAKTQTIPAVNLSREELEHFEITYAGKDTVELPDRVQVETDHFTVSVKEIPEMIKESNIWFDEKGYVVLMTGYSKKHGIWLTYRENYDSENENCIMRDIEDGQFYAITKWQQAEQTNENIIYDIEMSIAERLGGFHMNVKYVLDKNYHPKSYEEHFSFGSGT